METFRCSALVLIFFLAGASSQRTDDWRFDLWAAAYNRTFATGYERIQRSIIYHSNMVYVDGMNKRGGLTYELGENEFSDLSIEEFKAQYTCRQKLVSTPAWPVPKGHNHSDADDGDLPIPSEIDWRSHGAVTRVKNQISCGACWAFATVASIEGLNKLHNHHLVSLSAQELVDCDNTNHGCHSGNPIKAMEWVVSNGGLTTDLNYPYKNKKGKCNWNKARQHAVKIVGIKELEGQSEAALKRAVARRPVVVLITVEENFKSYKSGIYSGPCSSTNLNHAVTVVGYGKDGKDREFWIIKNSWGEGWGENGYVRMKRGVADKHGLCGIALAGTYPVM